MKVPECDLAIVTSGAIPVPVSITVWGLLASPGPSLIVNVPLIVPVVIGVKMMLTVHAPPEPEMTAPLVHEFVPIETCPAVVGVVEIVTDDEVPLVSVTGIGELGVFISWPVVKIKGFGLTLTMGFEPPPERGMTTVPPPVP
jgi:hypothetical protein